MRASRIALAPLVCGAAVTVVSVAVVSAGARSSANRTITLLKALPTVVRVNEHLSVKGRVSNAPSRAGAALQARESNTWLVVARAHLHRHGAFALAWHVPSPAYRSILLRVVAGSDGVVIASTRPQRITVGPAAVYCAPAVPPSSLPPGDGWIAGGLYGEGGAYPGVYACISEPYTLTVTGQQGAVIATEHVGPSKSYTVVVAPGQYKLKGGCGSGSATVTAGERTVANMYCLYP